MLAVVVAWTMIHGVTAQGISGVVKDGKTKELLPYVNVYFDDGHGTFTDDDGNFEIEKLVNQDSLRFSLLGYEDIAIDLTTASVPLQVTLSPTAIGLDVVEISGKSENLGKKLIQRVIAESKTWEEIEDDYSVDCYRRTNTEYYFEPSKADTLDTIPGWRTGALFEEYATHYWDDDSYKKVVKAELSNTSNGNLKSYARFNVDRSFSGANLGITFNPVDIFLQPQQIFFSVYDNVWKNTSISDRPISSILSDVTFATYKFTLSEMTMLSDTDTLFTVVVEPRFKESATYSGELVIDGTTDRVVASVLKIDNGLVTGLRNLEVTSTYGSDEKGVSPTQHSVRYDYKIGKEKYQVTTDLKFTDRVDDPIIKKNFFNNEVVTYEVDALERDIDRWASLRTVEMDSTLLDFVIEQDSVYAYEHSAEYYRVQDSTYNANGIMDYLFRGYGWKKRSIGLTTSFDPVISMVQLNFIGGLRYNFGSRVEKEFLNGNKLNVGGYVNYGPDNRDLRGRLRVSYTYLPRKFARFYGGIGNVYDIITESQTFESIISPRNIIVVKDLEFGHAFEVVNGLYLESSIQYAIKESIGELDLPEWNQIFGINSEPLNFETYRSLFLNLELIYRFNQRFITRGRRKLLLSNHSPTIKLAYRQGIPNFIESEVDFSQLTLDVYQQTKPTRLGTTNWRVTGGLFPHKQSIRDIENVYFRGENLIFFSDPLQNLQRLDETLNTNDPYARAGVIHHFDGFILDKVPLINKLQMEVIGGAGALALADRDYGQFELYVGVGKKFKLFKETVQVAVYRMSAIDTNARRKGGFVVGFNLFDAFNGQWLY